MSPFTYFTIMIRGNAYNEREWYVEELSCRDSLFKIHKLFDLVFTSFEDCEDACCKRIDKEGGVFIKSFKESGPEKGRRRGPYKMSEVPRRKWKKTC